MHSSNSNSLSTCTPYLFVHPASIIMVVQGEPLLITEHDISPRNGWKMSLSLLSPMTPSCPLTSIKACPSTGLVGSDASLSHSLAESPAADPWSVSSRSLLSLLRSGPVATQRCSSRICRPKVWSL